MRYKLMAVLIVQLMLFLPVYTAEALNINDVELTNFAGDSTSVQWETDEAANATVHFGEQTLIDSGVSGNVLGRQHYLTFPTTSGVNYSYIVESCTSDECVKSDRGEFTAGEDQTPPYLNVSVPSVTSENRIDVHGFVEPFSEVQVFLNGQIIRVLRSTDTGNGIIRLIGVALPSATNTLLLKAEDPAGNLYEQSYTIRVDVTAPELKLFDFPAVVTDPTFTLSGNVDEFADIEIFVGLAKDSVPPGRVQGLRITPPVGQNVVTLRWDRPSDDDVLEYMIYRNDQKLAVEKDEEFKDVSVASGAGYTYRVSAIDTSCNEGPLSDSVDVQTASGGNADAPTMSPASSSCKESDAFISTDGSFSQGLQLLEGDNVIRIVARDVAGNVFIYENTTHYDSTGPVIEEHNLEAISPSYVADVTVRGKISEKATVFVMLEGEVDPIGFGQTDASGNFEIPAKLTRKIKETKSSSGSQYQFGGGEEGYRNNLYIRAVDIAGREASTGVVPVIYAQCGFGNWWDIQITNPTPSTINPRLLLEGMGTFSFNVQLEYLGPDAEEVQLDRPAFHTMALSRDELALYDNVPPPQERWTQDHKKGYVQFTLPTPAFPESDAAHPNGWTQVMKELNISEHRRGECKLPGFGCYKIPLQLELQFTRIQERLPGETIVTGVAGPRAERLVQRVCVPVEIAIDQRIDTDVLPNKFLKNSAKFFDGALNLIDSILDPIEKLYDITYYLYLAGTIINFFEDMSVRAACRGGVLGTLQKISGGGFQKEVAEAGLCKIAYGEGEKEKKTRDNCLKCQKALNKNRKRIQRMQMVGDRLFCPAAPSLQKYIDNAQQQGRDLIQIGDKKYGVGNDCADPTISSIAQKSMGSLGKKGIKEVYEDFLETKDHKPSEDAGYNKDKVNCANQHPVTGECCGYQYNEEWGTACSLFKPNYEIKESKALADQQSRGKMNARRFKSARSGICSAKGEIDGDFVKTQIMWTPMNEEQMKDWKKDAPVKAEGKVNQIIVVGGDKTKAYNSDLEKYMENPTGRTLPYVKELEKDPHMYIGIKRDAKGNMNIWRGYRTTEATLVTTPALGRSGNDKIAVGSQSYIQKFHPTENLNRFFMPGDAGTIRPYEQVKIQWERALCGEAGCNDNELRGAFNAVYSKVSNIGDDYIVDPMEDLVASFKCGCIVGMRNHLKVWRNMLGAIRNCFKSIEVTGDGTAGACQAVLSRFVCDTIYSIIKCYRARSGVTSPGRPQGTFSGIGGIGRQISQSGVSAQQTLNARYGGNNLFRAGFAEEKLVNSMCLFAFTGDWKLDPQAMLEVPEAQEPVASQPFLFPCERRFIGFDTATIPSGFTIWNYHMGVDLFSGADVRYSLELVCSDDYSCDPNEGYVGGKCDCVGLGEKTQIIPVGTGHLKQFDNIGEAGDVYETVQGPYRYDKARLKWNWRGKNNQVERDEKLCTFQTQGGGPQAFCAWDILTNTFRCSSEVFEDYYARFNREPTPMYAKSDNPVFALGDPIKFEVPITQRIPETAACSGGSTCEHTKFLVYNVYNQHGAVIYSNDPKFSKVTESSQVGKGQDKAQETKPIKPLATNGERPYIIDFGPLKQGHMNVKGGSLVVPYRIRPLQHSHAVRSVTYTGQQMKDNLVIKFEGKTASYSVYSATAPIAEGEGFKKDSKIGTTSTAHAERDDFVIKYQGIELRIKKEFGDPQKGGTVEIYIPKDSEELSTTSDCDFKDVNTKGKIFKWRASFEIREAESFAIGATGPGNQVSVVAGQKQRYPSVSFDVGCGETGDLKVPGTVQSRVLCAENVPGQLSCLCSSEATHRVDAQTMDSKGLNWREKYKDELCGTYVSPFKGDVCIDNRCRSSDVPICSDGQRGECYCMYDKEAKAFKQCSDMERCEVTLDTNKCIALTPEEIAKLNELERKAGPIPPAKGPYVDPFQYIDPDPKVRRAQTTLDRSNTYKTQLVKAAADTKMDIALLAAIIDAESSWTPNLISSSGCTGLFQVCLAEGQSNLGPYGAAGNDITGKSVKRCCDTDPSVGEDTRTQCKTEHETYEEYGLWDGAYNCKEAEEMRLDPNFNIWSGSRTFANKVASIRGTYLDSVRLSIAAYNMGQHIVLGVLKNELNGRTDATWEQVHAVLTNNPDLLEKYGPRTYTGYSQDSRQKKVRNVGVYVNNVGTRYLQYKQHTKDWGSAAPPATPPTTPPATPPPTTPPGPSPPPPVTPPTPVPEP